MIKMANGMAEIKGFGMVHWETMDANVNMVLIKAPAYYVPTVKMYLLSHKTTHATMKTKLSMLILEMPISCNCKLQLQTIFLESKQAPRQFMLTSAWAHVSLFPQDLDMFLL